MLKPYPLWRPHTYISEFGLRCRRYFNNIVYFFNLGGQAVHTNSMSGHRLALDGYRIQVCWKIASSWLGQYPNTLISCASACACHLLFSGIAVRKAIETQSTARILQDFFGRAGGRGPHRVGTYLLVTQLTMHPSSIIGAYVTMKVHPIWKNGNLAYAKPVERID